MSEVRKCPSNDDTTSGSQSFSRTLAPVASVDTQGQEEPFCQLAELHDQHPFGLHDFPDTFSLEENSVANSAEDLYRHGPRTPVASKSNPNNSTAGDEPICPLPVISARHTSDGNESMCPGMMRILPPHDALTLATPFENNGTQAQPLGGSLYLDPQLATLSKYSNHMNVYERCVMLNCLKGEESPDCPDLVRTISALVTTFVKVAWSNMEAFFKYTNSSETVAKLAVWRFFPSPFTLASIPERLQPTPLQRAIPHFPVIEWCIFPFVRDKLILHHALDPTLDEICGDIGQSYVVEADLKDLVMGAKSLTVTLSFPDLVHGMDNNPPWFTIGGETSNPHAISEPRPRVKLPAPSLQVLLHTREYAWEVYRHLDFWNLGDKIRLDSSLFTKYPHLYEPDPAIAQGIPLHSGTRFRWTTPRPLDNIAMEFYQSCAAGTRLLNLQ